MNSLVVNPEYKKLYEEIEELRIEVLNLITERDYLWLHECPRIQAEYTLKIGRLQLETFNKSIEILRLKRTIEIYQMLINKQQEIDEDKIQEILDQEYEEYQEQVRLMVENIEIAEAISSTPLMSNEDSTEFKTMYRELIKTLHPDLSHDENATEEEERYKAEMLIKVVDAYESSSIEELRTLYILVKTKDFKEVNIEEQGNTLEELEETKEKLIERLNTILEQIAEIINSFPYNAISFLNDKKAVKAKQKEYEETLKEYEEAITDIRKVLKDIVERYEGKK